MVKYLGLSIFYILYLLILGQGCSALKGVDHVISVPIPNFDTLKEIKTVEFPEFKTTKIPVEPKPIQEKSTEEKQIKEELGVPVELASLPKKQEAPKVKPNPRKLPKIELKPIKKDIKKLTQSFEELKYQEEFAKDVTEKETTKTVTQNLQIEIKAELNNNKGFDHYGFEFESRVELVSFEMSMGQNIDALLARVEEDALNEQQLSEASVAEQTPAAYDPTDSSLLGAFGNDGIELSQIQDIVQKKEASTDEKNVKPAQDSDELVLIDYSEEEESESVTQATAVSNRVQAAIKREMAPVAPRIALVSQVDNVPSATTMNSAIAKVMGQGDRNPIRAKRAKRTQSSKLTIIALEGEVGEKVSGTVQNFSFIPSFDDGMTIQDFNEGEVTFDYSLQNESGMIRGSLVKNHYARTTIEVPLGGEYTKIEVPLFTTESLADFIDKYELSGYGGFFLIDLGELLQDVEIEQFGKKRGSAYEQRFFLDENLKVIEEGQHFRYVFFAGVVPGNININYLGVNGQETSKIGFIAPDEVTFDMSILQRPVEHTFNTYLQHTLGKTPSELDLNLSRILNVENGKNPERIAPGKFVLKTDWSIKGTRTYIEVGHLNDPIFVGLDGEKSIELPSLEFIKELLTNFRLDSLNNECALQLNFSSAIKRVQVFGENSRGPAVFDMSYLDKDGIFSPELSPLTEKLLLLGNEEGIFNIFVEYENGKQDYLKTFCTQGAYLLEQL